MHLIKKLSSSSYNYSSNRGSTRCTWAWVTTRIRISSNSLYDTVSFLFYRIYKKKKKSTYNMAKSKPPYQNSNHDTDTNAQKEAAPFFLVFTGEYNSFIQ